MKNTANFAHTLSQQIILFDGPMETRLKYESEIPLTDDFAIFHMMNTPLYRDQLAQFYAGDIAVSQEFQLPIILNLPTYRASAHYMVNHGYTAHDVAQVNTECYQFVNDIRNTSPQATADIFILGPVGPKHDAYDPSSSLSIETAQSYHATQINALVAAGVDLISIATMPTVAEALGAAQAAAVTGTPYTIGFIVNNEGLLIDSTPLSLAIKTIDQAASIAPLAYLFFCTHPSVAVSTLKNWHPEYKRIKGIKANGSCKPIDQLAQANCALADPPEEFARIICELTQQYDWHLIGGCCGTGRSHLRHIAATLKNQMRIHPD